MRKRVRILLLVAVVAAIVVPVGFALSLDTSSTSVVPLHAIVPVSQVTTSTGPIVATTSSAVIALPEIPDGAKLLATGCVLFGLAAAMKRSNRHDQRKF
jgi:hypothetical protein